MALRIHLTLSLLMFRAEHCASNCESQSVVRRFDKDEVGSSDRIVALPEKPANADGSLVRIGLHYSPVKW